MLFGNAHKLASMALNSDYNIVNGKKDKAVFVLSCRHGRQTAVGLRLLLICCLVLVA